MLKQSIYRDAYGHPQSSCLTFAGIWAHHMKFLIVGMVLAFFGFADGLYARTLLDQLGRQVAVGDSPQRVIALAPNITEIVYTLGQQHRLIGVSQFSDYPPEAKLLPKVGSYAHLDLEKIVSLQPDLCIAIKDGNPKEVAMRLAALHVPVYVVNPKDLDTVLNTVLDIGRLLNAEGNAKEVVGMLKSRIKTIDASLSQIKHRPRVFVQIGISPIVSAGSHTFIHELVERAGGINVAKGPVTYPRFSREQVLSMAPDVIVITSMARGALFQEVKDEWMKWQSLPAARENRIFIQDSNLCDRPTPRLVDGLELLARLIHPEIFKDSP